MMHNTLQKSKQPSLHIRSNMFLLLLFIIYLLKPPQVRKTYHIVYYIHTNVSQIINITVYVLQAGQ